jgi:hypothetical protein
VAAAAGWGYVDWWAGFFGLATIAVVLRMKEGLPARWAALAGVLAGFAAGVKYSAAIALAAGLAALLAAVPTRRGVRLAAIFLAAGAAVWLPWLIKNFEGKGAPFYPYLGSTASISAVRQSAVRSSVAPPPLSHSLVVPLAATVLGHEQSPGFASDIGPLLLALLPGLFFLPSSERRPLLPLAFFLFTGWISWAVAGRVSGLLIQTRLYFVLLPAWAVLAGCGFQGYTRLSLGTVRGSRLVGAMTALVVGLSLTASLRAAAQANALAPILGSESPETYLSRRLGSYFASQESLGRLPGGSRTLFLWEPRGLYCPTECGPDAWIDEWLVARRTYPSAEAARQAWTARGFTHLLLFRPGRAFVEREDARYTAEDWTSLDELLGQATEVEAIGDAYTLYRLD